MKRLQSKKIIKERKDVVGYGACGDYDCHTVCGTACTSNCYTGCSGTCETSCGESCGTGVRWD